LAFITVYGYVIITLIFGIDLFGIMDGQCLLKTQAVLQRPLMLS